MTTKEMLTLILKMQRQAEQDRADFNARFEEQKRQAQKTDQRASQAQKHVGDLMRKYGSLVESLVDDGTAQKLESRYTGRLQNILRNMPLSINKGKTSDLDRIFMYEKAVVVVDIKSKYRVQDLDKLRFELFPALAKDILINKLCSDKYLYIAIAALYFADNRVKAEATKAGYYVIKILNENSRIESAPDFKPKIIDLKNN